MLENFERNSNKEKASQINNGHYKNSFIHHLQCLQPKDGLGYGWVFLKILGFGWV